MFCSLNALLIGACAFGIGSILIICGWPFSRFTLASTIRLRCIDKSIEVIHQIILHILFGRKKKENLICIHSVEFMKSPQKLPGFEDKINVVQRHVRIDTVR